MTTQKWKGIFSKLIMRLIKNLMANVIHNDERFKNVSTKFKNKRWMFTNRIFVQHFILEDLTF